MTKAIDPAVSIQVTDKGQIVIEVQIYLPDTHTFKKHVYSMTLDRSRAVAQEVAHFSRDVRK